MQIKNYEGDAADLQLDFVVTDPDSSDTSTNGCEYKSGYQAPKEVELIYNGASTPVTDANRLLYVHLCARWHLRRVGGAAAAAFSRGLAQARTLSGCCKAVWVLA